MTAPSDATRLAAEGVTIQTTRGPLRLVYGFRALRALEDRYGSIVGLQDAMQALLASMGDDGRGRAFGPMADIIVPALLHNGLTADQAEDALLPHLVGEYVVAMQDAMEQAFPDAPPPAAEPTLAAPGNDQGPPAAPAAGPGQSGTTSPPAATAAPTPSSGA